MSQILFCQSQSDIHLEIIKSLLDDFFYQMFTHKPNGALLKLFSLKWDQNVIFGCLCMIKPDSDRITTFEHFISRKWGILQYMSAILDF